MVVDLTVCLLFVEVTGIAVADKNHVVGAIS